MIDQTFSARNLLRLTTRLDPKKYRLGKNKKDYLSSLEKVSQAALSDEFKFSAFSRSTRAGKTVYTVTNHTDEFIIRKLNDNLSRIYNVKQSNRAEIIGQAIPLLKEKIPFFLLKLDIKDFYETIDRTTLMERIAQDSALAFRSKLLLNQLFATQSHFPGTGIPRGVSLSATLSEIYMKDFDGAARTLDGVYFFARYVDDILIFAHSDPTPIKLALANRLPPGMYFNDTKERLLGFNRNGNCHLYNGEPELSYLGYRFVFRPQSAIPTGGKPSGSPPLPPRLSVKISESKLKKLKRRIMLAIFSFFKDRDFNLLESRIRFLTGNCQMKRDADNGRLLSGIYYNYSLIDESGILELKELTNFLRKALRSKDGAFGGNIQTYLAKDQRRRLLKYCFEAGFRKKITYNASPKTLKRIKECWQHV
ncbi:antiviral reverse transcriptase Drt3a [Burkholderia multivorans]|uniref:antiviral reverse transcriptase Drt3a n=1 Tax=Burkholderia multivorans TaxID=87883 RepID=UPI000CFFD2FF|nr:antiviral reverse transcriptase Drt3a [Burkholderia multivorans]MBU9402484.1 RNA-directed DNA polymerase [Burkholderia multivorans]MDN8051240.1 antiviral reverse transcriptase Drt3a [Burkholderia multivorans]PRH28964.1 hypothetical protein C6T71_06155 [Burkholderia multivorans]